MAGHSRPKDGVASACLCPAIHVFLIRCAKNVDARDTPGHDELPNPVIARSEATKQSRLFSRLWIASRSLSSGAHSRDPLARNDGLRQRRVGKGALAPCPP